LEIYNNSTTQTNNTNQQTTHENDLTEYNRSKAEMEEKLRVENERIQREGAIKSQNYTTAMKAGISANNSGNYAEAKEQFSIALNNCNTAEARQKAQEYYNNSVDAEKSQTKIKAVGDFTVTAINALDQYAKARKEEKRLKLEEMQNANKENEKRAEREINTMTDPKIYETYCDFVIANLETLGFQFTGISQIKEFKNDNKHVKFDFNKGELEAVVRQAYFKGTMQNSIELVTSNTVLHNLLLSSDLVAFLGSYNYWEDKTFDDLKRNNGNKVEYVLNFGSLFRLEKSQPFIETYMKPYRTSNYSGITAIIKEKQTKINEEQTQKAELIPVKSEKTPVNDITVQSIINKHIKAIGGLAKLKSIRNIVNVKESEEFKVKETLSSGKFNSEVTTKTGVVKTVFNGVNGYVEYSNKKNNFDDATVSYYKKRQPFSILELQEEPTLELGEMIVFKGKECYTIIKKDKANTINPVPKYFFDSKSGLLIGYEILYTRSHNSNFTSYVYYDDYREVGGILFPFIEQNSTLNKISITKTIEIKLNAPLTDKDFE
jgi:hypothetical protein